MTPVRWILLPGLDGTGELFRWFLPYVVDERVVVVTYPGNAFWTLDDYVDHACAVVALEPRCIVIAESFSGPIALRLLRRNANIIGLVLVASFVTCPNPLLKALPVSLLAAVHKAAISETLLRLLCLGWNATTERLGLLKNVARTIPADVLGARLALLRGLDETNSLDIARVPILSVVAAQDRLVTVGIDAHGRSDVQTAIIEGPHFLLQARPAECWRTIDAWWRALERTRAHD